MQTPRPPEQVPGSTSIVALPKTAVRPPPRPQDIVTGSIAKPVKAGPRLLQTTARVSVRARAEAGAPVMATLEAGETVRELARSGKWRLVSAAGRKGWVHADYLAKPQLSPRRPKLPIPVPAKPRKAAADAKAAALRKP
jgi:hypothetical protein